MIAKHSHEQSQKGEGVEVIENRPHEVKIYRAFDFIALLIFYDRTQNMAQDSTQRKEST